MKKTILLFLACSCSLPAWSQYAKILADPTVSWAVEIELVIAPEVDYARWPADSFNTSMVLKTLNTHPELLDQGPESLNGRLMEMVMQQRWPAFANSALTEPLESGGGRDRLMLTDTIVTFNPETYEERVQIFSHSTSAQDYPLVKVRQLLLYRAKTAEFEVITLAIAPTLSNGLSPFWLAVPSVPATKAPPKLSDPDISWARRLRTKGASPVVDDLPSLKQPQLPLMPTLIQRVRTDSQAIVLNVNTWRPLSLAQLDYMFTGTDTIVTFDPETYEEKVQVIHNEIKPEDLHQLRLVQDWYWDERRHRLITRLVAVAPLIDIQDGEGNFRYQAPLFYRLNKTRP